MSVISSALLPKGWPLERPLSITERERMVRMNLWHLAPSLGSKREQESYQAQVRDCFKKPGCEVGSHCEISCGISEAWTLRSM